MLMETDGRNSEMYININQSYLLCNSDTVLTELAFDDIHRLEPSSANTLLQLIVVRLVITHFTASAVLCLLSS